MQIAGRPARTGFVAIASTSVALLQGRGLVRFGENGAVPGRPRGRHHEPTCARGRPPAPGLRRRRLGQAGRSPNSGGSSLLQHGRFPPHKSFQHANVSETMRPAAQKTFRLGRSSRSYPIRNSSPPWARMCSTDSECARACLPALSASVERFTMVNYISGSTCSSCSPSTAYGRGLGQGKAARSDRRRPAVALPGRRPSRLIRLAAQGSAPWCSASSQVPRDEGPKPQGDWIDQIRMVEAPARRPIFPSSSRSSPATSCPSPIDGVPVLPGRQRGRGQYVHRYMITFSGSATSSADDFDQLDRGHRQGRRSTSKRTRRAGAWKSPRCAFKIDMPEELKK